MATGGEASASFEAWIGRIFDNRYKLVRILGEGGMGAVFVAEHLRLKNEVAFKIIRPEIAGDTQMAARFAQEAMATAQIESPHIASAIDFGELPEGGAYLVTQLARGRSLRAIAGEAPIPWPRVAEIGAQIADALVTAHGLGIIHRDLKPDNIIVGERDDGTPLVTVLDFGIAKRSRDAKAPAAASEPLTGFGLVLGTPGYMAPEQAVGDAIDGRTDLYALGVILWECVAGARLWTGESLTELVTRQLREPAPAIPVTPSVAVPPDFEAIVASLLARMPSARPAGAMAVRSALRGLITVTPGERAAAAALPLGAAGGAADGVGANHANSPQTASASPFAAPIAAAAAAPIGWIPTAPGLSTEPGHPQATAPMIAAAPPAQDRQILLVLVGCFVLGGIALLGLGRWLLHRGDRQEDAAAQAGDAPTDKPRARAGGRMSIHDDDDDAAASEGTGDADDDDAPVIIRDKKGRSFLIPRRPRRLGGG